MVDIGESFLRIKELKNTVESKMKKSKSWIIDERHCDAFIYVTNGCCFYEFINDGYSFTARKDEIIYLAADAVYKMTPLNESYDVIFCDFEFEFSNKRKSAIYTPKNHSEILSLFKKLHKGKKNNAMQIADSFSLLYKIYAAVIESSSNEYISPTSKEKIAEIRRYIDEDIKNTDLSVEFLAAKINMSEVYLRRLFKLQYGISPSAYITNARINRAKSLLFYPFFSLDKVANECGFVSVQYFCRVFKKQTGVTPTHYRKDTRK